MFVGAAFRPSVWGRELSEEVERIRKREERLKKEEEDRKVCRSVRGGGGVAGKCGPGNIWE